MSIQILCPSFNWIFLKFVLWVFLLFNGMSFSYILNINVLSNTWFSNIFSHSMDCLIILLMFHWLQDILDVRVSQDFILGPQLFLFCILFLSNLIHAHVSNYHRLVDNLLFSSLVQTFYMSFILCVFIWTWSTKREIDMSTSETFIFSLNRSSFSEWYSSTETRS